jgi:hypothetical protein
VVVFTPDDEPYMGLTVMYQLDLLIVRLLEQQLQIASWTMRNDLSPLQRAASELAPAGCSIGLSIRELVRQAYLLSALVLTRPLLERVATLSYLVEHPSAVSLWEQGWPHNKRPSLRERMKSMGIPPAGGSSTDVPGAPTEADIRAIVDRYNGLVHGDPNAASSTAVLLSDGRAGHSVGKDLGSPARASRICGETLAFLAVLMAQCHRLFPGLSDAGEN